jgi:hypothetical protein
VRGELGNRGQVQPPVGQHLEEDGVLAGGPGRGDAEVGLGLGEMKDLGAVGKHRGGGFAGEEAALIDFTDVGDEVGLHAAGLAEDLSEAA